MESEEHVIFRQLAEQIKSQPDYLQPMNLIFLTKANKTCGPAMEKMARKLAEYGVPVEKVVPCLLDIMIILTDNWIEEGA